MDAVLPRSTSLVSPPSRSRLRSPPFAVWMLLACASVVVIAYWDAKRESDAALADFGEEQSTLSDALASLAGSTQSSPEFGRKVAALEQAGSRRIFFRVGEEDELNRTDGSKLRSPLLLQALRDKTRFLRLDRDQAPTLGLSARSGIVALTELRRADGTSIDVAVASSAARLRDRELRAEWRLVLSVLAGSGLVLGFGLTVLRRQRRQLELARELAVADVVRKGEHRLARADKLATLGALATGVAHEISTPLGVIMGRAEQLQRDGDNSARTVRAASTIIDQVQRIGAVMRGFLGLARGEFPALEYAAPARLAEQARTLVEHRFEQSGVRLETSIDGDLPKVACDPRLFEQVLVNLLLNACDACDRAGNVCLAVSCKDGEVTYAITDDGAGITDEAASRATEPFFTTKPAGRGTGLGLAIANEIVKHHGGALTIAPRGDRQGTRVVVNLPAAHGVRT